MSKGSQRRPTDEAKFRENYDRIFQKPRALKRVYPNRTYLSGVLNELPILHAVNLTEEK